MLYIFLNNRRKALGMSIDELVEKSNVPKSTVTKILTGVSTNPTLETVKAITYALGLTLAELDTEITVQSTYSDRALAVARAYDSLTDYGKEVIDSVIKIDGKQKGFFFKGVPHISELKLDGTVEAKVAAMREIKELQTEEVKTEE